MTGSTYCHLLWDSAFIDQHGDVFACCHSAPAALGNIARTDMATIWAGGALAGFRAQSNAGALKCAVSCNILSADEKAGLKPPPVCDEHPKNIWLLWSEFCHIRCIMCPQDHQSRIALDAEVLKRQVDWTRVQEVEIQGGEIFVMKGALEFYRWLTTDAGKKVNVITNGLLVTPSWADHMVHTAAWIQVSVNAATKRTHEQVNAGSTFERVIDNLRLLVRAKQNGRGSAQVIYKFTIVPENAHEIPDAIALAQEIGCDEIAFGYDRPVPGFLAANPALAERVRERLTAIDALPIKVEQKRLRHLGLVTIGEVAPASEASRARKARAAPNGA